MASTRAPPYTARMRVVYVLVPLLALLVAAIWFAASTWVRLGGEPVPLWGWFAMGGGIFFSLLIGGGLMALMFYSSRHGYDEPSDDRR
jgi:hypothetical protein